ncbi:MAG: hypothetical protein DRO07_00840, partial [Candidatus Iainarchaeum archaeon]
MEPTDWIFSAIIFVGIVASLFVLVPSLLPQKPDVAVESQLKEVMDSITKDIYVKALILKSDCNAQLYDCNRYYPVVLDANTDLNYILSKPFEMDLNKLFTILAPQELANVFVLESGTLEPHYDVTGLTLNASVSQGVINVHNNYLDANITDSNAVIAFADSEKSDLTLTFPTMPISLLKNTKKLVVVGNDANNFHLV